MPIPRFIRFPGFLAALTLLPHVLPAAPLEATVTDKTGKPVENTVVYALPKSYKPPKSVPVLVVDQIDKEFVNHVTPVQMGTPVSFPNSDDIRHHVYSFSPAKTFELPLYMGTPAKPVVFDKPGAVALGCNIHDWMLGYIYVVETPFFTKTGADGRGKLELPPGEYDVRIWHPEMRGKTEQTGQRVSVTDIVKLGFSLDLKHVWKVRRAPGGSDGGPRY
ncbi:methylamine utilization protein [Methylomagnum sp.]